MLLHHSAKQVSACIVIISHTHISHLNQGCERYFRICSSFGIIMYRIVLNTKKKSNRSFRCKCHVKANNQWNEHSTQPLWAVEHRMLRQISYSRRLCSFSELVHRFSVVMWRLILTRCCCCCYRHNNTYTFNMHNRVCVWAHVFL